MCFLHVPTIGFAFDCAPEPEATIDYGLEFEEAASSGTNVSAAELFTIEFNTIYNNGSQSSLVAPFGSGSSSSFLQMNVSYTSATVGGQGLSCPGTKITQTCKLWPAIIKYPVMIRNSSEAFTVSIGEQLPLQIEADTQDLGTFNQSGNQQNG